MPSWCTNGCIDAAGTDPNKYDDSIVCSGLGRADADKRTPQDTSLHSFRLERLSARVLRSSTLQMAARLGLCSEARAWVQSEQG